jgi:hypothetical protein
MLVNLRSSPRLLFAAAVLGAAALASACGGGGGTAMNPAPAQTSISQPDQLSLSIKIPKAPPASSSRRPSFISPATQSLGVVVTNQGFTPSPAQFANVASCPQVSGVTTCTIVVQALPGNVTLAVSAYSGQNGTGTVLSSGSITATIPSSGPVPTLTVTLSGEIASIVVSAVDSIVPIGQPALLNVVAKDSNGASIVGTYDNPIVLTAPNLTFSASSLATSTAASSVTATWKAGFTGPTASTVTANADGVNGTLLITPASGFAFYTTGSNQNDDFDGFKMILGGDGNLYYTAIGKFTCNAQNVCTSSTGALHQFNPTSNTDVEVDVATEPQGLTYASDGSVWFAGGGSPAPNASPLVYRMAPASFSAASLTSIAVPGADAGTSPNIRDLTEDNLGNIWIADLGSFRFMSMPAAGPYTTAAITTYVQPTSSPPSTPFASHARTVDYAGGDVVYGMPAGYVMVVNSSDGIITGQYTTNLQTALGSGTESGIYDAATDGTNVYLGQIGNYQAAYSQGDLEKFNPGTNAFTTLPSVAGPVAVEPVIPSINGALLYYADFSNDGLGVTNTTAGTSRFYPIDNSFYIPDGIAALADGTAWFTCYGNQLSTTAYAPICVGHTIYLSDWGLWPGSSIAIDGVGAAGAQLVGIMEADTANSGPFTAASSDTSVCTVSTPSDHDFAITGVAAGACSVTVTDTHGSAQVIDVTVTTTTGTVQEKHRGGIVRP